MHSLQNTMYYQILGSISESKIARSSQSMVVLVVLHYPNIGSLVGRHLSLAKDQSRPFCVGEKQSPRAPTRNGPPQRQG